MNLLQTASGKKIPQVTFYLLQGLLYATIPLSAFQVNAFLMFTLTNAMQLVSTQVPLLISLLSLLGLLILLFSGDSDGW